MIISPRLLKAMTYIMIRSIQSQPSERAGGRERGRKGGSGGGIEGGREGKKEGGRKGGRVIQTFYLSKLVLLVPA